MSKNTLNEAENHEPDLALAGPTERCVMRLRRFNEWRRGADFEQPDPKEIGYDIDFATDKLEQILNICTTRHETNDQLISRVRQILSS